MTASSVMLRRVGGWRRFRAGEPRLGRSLVLPCRRSTTRRALGVAIGLLVAGVWAYHGLYNKLLDGEPRHRLIVQAVPGLAGALGVIITFTVGIAEVVLAVWILSGRWPRTCAAVQTIGLLTMNAIELTWARQHLLWPAMLVPVNVAFLCLAWTSALLRSAVANAPLFHRVARLPLVGLHVLWRHPFAVRARFRHCLVLTYAVPREHLEPLLPPGLVLDTIGPYGFVAVAIVQTERLRPARLPAWCGRDFLLVGYRVFVKFRTPEGRTLRGLRILRSDADRQLMVMSGNLLTHYYYHHCRAMLVGRDGRLDLTVRTSDGMGDVHVIATLGDHDAALPPGSPFTSPLEARRYAGPLPYTFDYEPQTHSIVAIKGVRTNWRPTLVSIHRADCSFLRTGPFAHASPVLAAAFYVHDIDYRWERGVRHPLPQEDRT